MVFVPRQRLSRPNLSFQQILWVLAVLGLFGFVLLFAPGGPSFGGARLELGGALVSGVVLSGAFLAAERRLGVEDRRHEERTAANLMRSQYQLALGMADSLARRELSGLDLSGLQLPNRDLRECGLRHTDLFESDLTGANLSGADLHGADLTFGVLKGAQLINANLICATLSGSDLQDADLTGANLFASTLYETTPRARPEDPGEPDIFDAVSHTLWEPNAVNLTGANLTGVNFGQIDVSALSHREPVEPDLARATLTGAKWDPARPPTWPRNFTPPKNAWSLAKDR